MQLAYIFVALLILLFYTVTLIGAENAGAEGFENIASFEDPEDVYDPEYASIYNQLWHSEDKLQYERVSIQDIVLADKSTSSVKVLDMCCGTAPHACWFRQLGVDYIGVDIAEGMLGKAREGCPSAKFIKGDVSQVQLFPPKSKTHCLLLNFSVYMFENSRVVADNAHHWLQPDGSLVVHMVDPDKFDPVLDLASPFAAFSLQKYSVSRKTDSEIYFDKFKYTGRFNKKSGEDTATFDETLKYYNKTGAGGFRENKHRWNMPSKERLINIIQTAGFRHVETVNLVRCKKEYQYLVYFTK